MWGMDRDGGDIREFKNVANYSDCNRKCNNDKACFLWTYTTGMCWLKNENTFLLNARNGVVTGRKKCKHGGKS